jgi:serine/threonine protein kinase
MRNKNWRQVESIFHTALNLGGEERISYLSRTCSGDATLLSEVESLISAFENESDFLEESAFSLGMNVLRRGDEKDLTGENIGFYEIKEKLGGGGMGDVYLAEDTRLNRKVALKFLRGNFGDDKWAKRQFIKEAQAVAMLEHSNICAVHSIEEIDEHNFIVMQFVEGETLAEFISERELSLEKILSIAHQIISAVAAAHAHGIIHRDIKPGNIMITSEGLVKVLDFGLAKVVEQKQKTGRVEENISQVSQNGLILGTVSYMSPEQLRAEKLDFRSDIFSVGIVLYEMLAKESPFNRKSQAETIAAILNDEPSLLTKTAPEISDGLGSIVQKCLDKDKEKRFQSAAEILVELDKVESANIRQTIPKRLAGFLLAATVVLLAILITTFFYTGKLPRKTLAVLPISFDNAPAEKEYLADGLTQSIIDELSNLSDLNVKSESIITRYKGKISDPLSVGKELNVDAVFVGTIKSRGDALFLESKLIRISDGSLIDNDDTEVKEANLNELPLSISSRVVSKIQSKLTDEDRKKLAEEDTESSEAKSFYLQGRYYLNHFKNKTEGDYINKAIRAFTSAKNIDQNYAKAWAGLADAHLAQSAPGVRGAVTPTQAVDLARVAANKALELDDTSCEAYYSLGMINYRYDWQWQEAERNFRRAISLNPQFLPSHFGLLNTLKMQQRYDEAIEEANKIKEIDPLSVTSDIQLALINYRKYDFDQTDRILSALLQRFPDDMAIKYVRVYQFLKTQRFGEAAEMLEPLYRSDKEEDKVLAAAPLGFAYAKMGRRDDALKIIDDLEKVGKNIYVPAQEKALIYVALGNYDKVFENLNLSCNERFASLPGWINDPVVDDVKADPRFAEIRKCVNL